MAQSFTALGRGNGFPFCLTELDAPDNAIKLSVPTLKQTMDAYWNFDSATFGGLTFDPDNEPKDLICDKTLNIGTRVKGSSVPNEGGVYSVSNNFPGTFLIGNKKYYYHGISMSYYREDIKETLNGELSNFIDVRYFSGLYIEGSTYGYKCIDETLGEEEELIGRSARSRSQTFSKVKISGIPFIKSVLRQFSGNAFATEKEDGTLGPVPGCPSPSDIGEPETPILKLHSY
tara:strand:+ start:96 stop:788 length:693 start_codon:yes stop_codon:yes gene_type:complete